MDRNIEMYCGVGPRFMKFMNSEFKLLKLWVMIEEDISQISKKMTWLKTHGWIKDGCGFTLQNRHSVDSQLKQESWT